MYTVCKKNQCVGCYACKDLCPKNAINIIDKISVLNAEINEKLCIKCNICHNVCQINYPLEKHKPILWWQGWSKNEQIRRNSSSGGLATQLSHSIIEQGGVICSCALSNGKFNFHFAETFNDLKGFAGSKYVKSNPEGIYKKIRKRMNEGYSILFIGLPCQCAAVKKTMEGIKNGTLYTIDLICHGSPSPKLLDAFLNQYNYSLNTVKDIRFREKEQFILEKDRKSIAMPGTMDYYSIAFLGGLMYTESCYKCYYADSERVSDITIGDSWGSEISEEIGKGISLILCNTEKGKHLLNCADIFLKDVDVKRAINSNPQLQHPTIMPKERKKFFEGFSKGIKFNTLVRKLYFKQCLKQFMKKNLIRLKLFKMRRGVYSISFYPNKKDVCH